MKYVVIFLSLFFTLGLFAQCDEVRIQYNFHSSDTLQMNKLYKAYFLSVSNDLDSLVTTKNLVFEYSLTRKDNLLNYNYEDNEKYFMNQIFVDTIGFYRKICVPKLTQAGEVIFDFNGEKVCKSYNIKRDFSYKGIYFSERWNVDSLFRIEVDLIQINFSDYSLSPATAVINKKQGIIFKNIKSGVVFGDGMLVNDKKKLIESIETSLRLYKPKIYLYSDGKDFVDISYFVYSDDLYLTQGGYLNNIKTKINTDTGGVTLKGGSGLIDYSDLIGFKFIEDWYLDTSSNSFHKEVKYYAPMVYETVEGVITGTKPLFWIKNEQ